MVAGVAPGAKLMVLKALGSDGGGGWDAVLAAVTYAAQRGADIAVLAIESSQFGQDLVSEYRQLAEIAGTYGMAVFIAAGNGGPGTGTAVGVPDSELLVPVGGYVSAEMWRRLFGKSVESDGPWLYSAVGPGSGGMLGPLVVAPAAAVAGVPYAVAPTWHELYEGTSVAVPHAAGAAALILSAARGEGLPVDGRSLVRSLAAGAIALQGVGPAQQGYGVLSVIDSAMYLASIGGGGGAGDLESWRVALGYAAGGSGASSGVLPLSPGEIGYASGTAWPVESEWRVTLTNEGPLPVRVALGSEYGQVQPERGVVYLEPGGSRQVAVRPADGWIPGLDDIDDLLVARDEATGAPMGGLLVRAPARSDLGGAGEGEGEQLEFEGYLPTGRTSRHYVELGDGYDWLEISLVWCQSAGEDAPPGALRVFLYSPTGYLVAELASAGKEPEPGGSAFPPAAMLLNPLGGLWEVVVWGEPGQMAQSDAVSYVVAVQAGGRSTLTAPRRVSLAAGDARGPVQVKATVNLPRGSGSVVVEALGWLSTDWGSGAGGGTDGSAGVSVSASSNAPVTASRVGTVGASGTLVWRLPAIPAGTAMLEVTLAGMGAGDADLLLYHLAGGSQGGAWTEVGRSEAVGSASERLQLISPSTSGQYAVVVRSRGADGPQEVVMGAIFWPKGSAVLDQIVLQAGVAGAYEISLNLPEPTGTRSEYRAILVLRDGRSMRPLMAVPVDVSWGLPGLLPIVAPSLSGGVGAMVAGTGPGREPAVASTVRVRSATTMQNVAASLTTSGRMARSDDGRLSLRQSLLGAPSVPGLGVEVVVRAAGHEPWTGEVYPSGIDEGHLVRAGGQGAGLDGQSPYAVMQAQGAQAAQAAGAWSEAPGGPGALRRKVIWQGGPR
jgi:hypothetical protein